MFMSRSPQVNRKYAKEYGSETRNYTIMTPDEAATGRKSSWTELAIHGMCRNLSPVIFQMDHLTCLYINDNQLTYLPPDICHLKRLVHLNASSNKLRSVPPELGRITTLRELLLNNNLLRSLPNEIGQLFLLQKLSLSGNPLTNDIASIYSEPNGTQKLLTCLLDRLSYNNSQPLPRPWLQLATPNDSHPVGLFTVMCYNVLCDKYATRQQYGYCPTWALSWEYRKKGILDEIRRGEADVIALQEIETEQFNMFFQPELKELGYDGIFSPRSRARSMPESERRHVDGCAIFYRRTKFSLVREHLIEFNQMAKSSAEGSHEMLNRVFTKDNIGFAAFLEAKDGFWVHGLPPEGHRQQQILVATCHIHWDPAYCDVKLVQTIMLMHELRNLISDSQVTLRPGGGGPVDCNSIPLVLCGDLNSLPDSGVVQYLQTGHMEFNHKDFCDIGYQDSLQKMSTTTGKEAYTHNFRLAQAYTPDMLACTNYTVDFKGVIDYVFHSSDWLRPLGALGMTDVSWFEQNNIVGCPHPSIPSDHLPLLVEFEFDPLETSSSSSTPQHSSSLVSQGFGGGRR